MTGILLDEEKPRPQMDDKEAIDLLEKQIKIFERAGIDMSGDREFFYVGEYDFALGITNQIGVFFLWSLLGVDSHVF